MDHNTQPAHPAHGPAARPEAMARRARGLGLSLASALALALLSGCGGNAMSEAPGVAAAARAPQADQGPARAIASAEASVLADPANAHLRLALGTAYLDAGRFASAETAFADAMTLGEQSPRAALSLALARIAQGRFVEGAAILNEWDGAIAKADLGLALALAGQPERGIHIMANAIRAGENSPKMRQNLAYAYAVAGRWREARLMAQQDLPAHEVNARIEQWAAMASADAYQHRIASLLQVPAGIADTGQPRYLALAGGANLAGASGAPGKGAPHAATGELAPQAASTAPMALAGAPALGQKAAPQISAPQLATPDELAAFAMSATGAAHGAASISPQATPPAPGQPSVQAGAEDGARAVLRNPPRSPLARIDPSKADDGDAGHAIDSFSAAHRHTHAAGPQIEPPAPGVVASANAGEPQLFVRNPVIQPLAAGPAAARPGPDPSPSIPDVPARARFAAAAKPGAETVPPGTHLVQLGSFASEQGARRAWQIYLARFPQLSGHEMVITQALVNGRSFWRVSAAGFDQNASRAMCSTVRSRSLDGCIAWAATSPLPGAINQGKDAGVRLARR